VKPRFNCAHISTKFLIDAVVSLRNYLVGIVDETAAKTRCPSSSKATTFSPTMHAFAIRWHFCMMLIYKEERMEFTPSLLQGRDDGIYPLICYKEEMMEFTPSLP